MKTKKRKALNVLLIIIEILIALLFAFCLYKAVTMYVRDKENDSIQEETQTAFFDNMSPEAVEKMDEELEAVYENKTWEYEEMDVSFMDLDFDSLLEINSDVKGWIYYPACKINFPVLQAEDNDFYLYKDIYKNYQGNGSIFIDCSYDESYCQCMTIYGHHMISGAMFGHLHYLLEDEEFAKENCYFWYITPERVYLCLIFSTIYTHPWLNYVASYFETDEEYLAFVEDAREKSVYDFGDIPVSADDKVLIISTCQSNPDGISNGRQAIYAKMVPVGIPKTSSENSTENVE